jgi:Xaa-Pro aminopeptidase
MLEGVRLNYHERIKKATDLMKTNNVDALVLSRSSESRSLYYLTGVDRYCATLVLHKDGGNTLLILEQDLIDAEEKAHADEVKIFNSSKSHYEMILEAITKNGLTKGTIGIEKPFLRHDFYEAFRGALPNAFQIINAVNVTGQLRLIKSKEEIQLIKKASMIASKTMESVATSIEQGVRENELAAIVEYELRKNGAEESATVTFISSGKRTQAAHPPASSRKLKPGDFVLVDVHPRIQGYCSDLGATFIVKDSNQKLIDNLKQVLEARDEAIQNIKIGEKISKIHLRYSNQLTDKGFIYPPIPYFTCSLHGIGISSNDPPSFWYPIDEDIKPGIVFAFAEAPTRSILNKELGIRFEDTYLVTEGGVEKLTSFQSDL